MALTGELSDLSLSELIEFFCNQRKTGRLKVIYPNLPGYFFIQAGALVDARIGSLSGIEAVYYALTLPNASFTFDMELEVEQRTIHQPWTQVVLEGLRRMDEGITPEPPINKEELPDENDLEEAFESVIAHGEQDSFIGPMALTVESMAGGGTKRRMIFGALAIAVLSIVAATLILTNRMARAESTASIPPVALQDDVAQNSSNTPDDSTAPQIAEVEPSNQATVEGGPSAISDAAAQLREREARERERRRAAEERADRATTDASTLPSTTTTTAAANAVKKPDAPKAGPKTVTVQVTYDEAGRVTQASGSDPTALRIARQKRFPSGKAGTTTVTIPIN
ncbi:MAG: DUF4388 domain-containing protein [Acidobacteria bacterium]|nr:DUF4388 domain-containing protein [Acidobacteriota bacterium]